MGSAHTKIPFHVAKNRLYVVLASTIDVMSFSTGKVFFYSFLVVIPSLVNLYLALMSFWCPGQLIQLRGHLNFVSLIYLNVTLKSICVFPGAVAVKTETDPVPCLLCFRSRQGCKLELWIITVLIVLVFGYKN